MKLPSVQRWKEEEEEVDMKCQQGTSRLDPASFFRWARAKTLNPRP